MFVFLRGPACSTKRQSSLPPSYCSPYASPYWLFLELTGVAQPRKQAAEWFTKATQVDPRAADSYFNLGTVRAPSASGLFIAWGPHPSCSTPPKAGGLRLDRARRMTRERGLQVMQQMRRHEEAVQNFRTAIDIAPDGAGAEGAAPPILGVLKCREEPAWRARERRGVGTG